MPNNKIKNQRRKMIYKIRWIVNQYRSDKRTGAIDPVKRSEYLKALFEEEEKRWR